MKVPFFIFEDHCESYIRWREMGLKDLCVIHIDAHLDVADEGLDDAILEKIRCCKSVENLEKFRKNEDVLWGGFHPGNYLYPAMYDGTVSHLIWVIPDHLPGKEKLLLWARQEVMQWVDLSLADYDSLHYEDNRVVGKLKGIDFEICFLKDLRVGSANYVWDIDTDYLIDEDDIPWISPMDLIHHLYHIAPNPLMITTAYSVNGGYLPPEQKYLGDLIEKTIKGQMTDSLRECYQYLMDGDRAILQKYHHGTKWYYNKCKTESFYTPYLNLRLAELCRMKNETELERKYMEEVRRLEPILILPAYDIAMIHFRRKDYDKALSLLKKTADIDETHFLMSHFISAVIYIKKEEYATAALHLETIIELKHFDNWNNSIRAHVLFIAGSTYLKGEKYKKALELMNKSIDINPDNAGVYSQRGRIYLKMEKYENAARDFRKYLRKKPDRLESMEVRLLLAFTYRSLDKKGMEMREVRRILKDDTTGFYSMKARLGRYMR
ncbi:MAG: tetratricopeptide repeat protein [Candidatus Eremiobacteraeota bacterium]|nr:tetratricopeptide repeat protein [Candidatus Eremiobacteraeota bacterium]